MIKKQKPETHAKKTKKENPLVLNADVGLYRPGHGLTKLGKIIKVTKSLLTVRWDSGETEHFGKAGQSFYGTAGESSEAIKPRRGDQQMWGTDEDPHLIIPSSDSKRRLGEERKEKAQREADRKAALAAKEADPEYQKRQADLRRYSELLHGISGEVENSWDKQTNFRIELENISPEKMDRLIQAIVAALSAKVNN
jgi:hypothetical protein